MITSQQDYITLLKIQLVLTSSKILKMKGCLIALSTEQQKSLTRANEEQPSALKPSILEIHLGDK